MLTSATESDAVREPWLRDEQGAELDAIAALVDPLSAPVGPLGRMAAQIDPTSGAFLGHHPQVLSHVGVVTGGINLGRQVERAT